MNTTDADEAHVLDANGRRVAIKDLHPRHAAALAKRFRKTNGVSLAIIEALDKRAGRS